MRIMKKADPYYKTKKWERLKRAALRRDGYQCQYAKRYGKNKPAEVVHHIFPREEYPEYQDKLWNLICLSFDAHNKMHDRNTGRLTAEGEELRLRTARRERIEYER